MYAPVIVLGKWKRFRKCIKIYRRPQPQVRIRQDSVGGRGRNQERERETDRINWRL